MRCRDQVPPGPEQRAHFCAGHPGRTVERQFVVPSALRTMSVVTLLSAVSGTVLLTHQHHHGEPAATTRAVAPVAGGGSAAFAASLISQPMTVDDQAQLRAQQQAAQRAATQAARGQALLKRAQLKKQIEARNKARRKAQRAAAARAEAAAARVRRVARAKAVASRSDSADPKALARLMLAHRGWGSGQFSCLNALWNRESGWNLHASNPSSGAYGIPQALPGSKMATAGPDWRNSASTQIRWGLDYIADRYGTPCGAWGHSEATGWY